MKTAELQSREKHRTESAEARAGVTTPWYLSTAALGFGGGILMWLAVPPVDWGWLGWFAPVAWLLLIRRPGLSGARPYWIAYLVGVAYWGTTVAWVRLPHWSAWFGWFALTAYLAFYLVLFIGLSRFAVHRLRVPLMLAAPAVWTGLEFVRAHLLTGFLMAALGHTQHQWTAVIQICDLCGAYGLSFLVMFVAACLASILPLAGKGWRFWPALPAAAALAAALAYGHFRSANNESVPGPKVALIQGSIDTEFNVDPAKQRRRIYDQYMQLSLDAIRANPDLDAVIWPETMYIMPLFLVEKDAFLPATELAAWPQFSIEEAKAFEKERRLPPRIQRLADVARQQFRVTVGELQSRSSDTSDARTGPVMLLGSECEHFLPGEVKRYNSSILLDSDGELVEYYHKMHPVMFGEYVPLGEVFPSLYHLTPLVSGLSAGTRAVVYDVKGHALTPNICYETILPHVIRRQLKLLNEAGKRADVLVTQTNDGWFWGSSALDMHLICGIFRAVECRKPLLIAANTGISASIDADGHVQQRAPRRSNDVIVARPSIDSRQSFYVTYGDWLAGLCAAFCAFVVAAFARQNPPRIVRRKSRTTE